VDVQHDEAAGVMLAKRLRETETGREGGRERETHTHFLSDTHVRREWLCSTTK